MLDKHTDMEQEPKSVFTTRKIVVAGVLSAIAVFLGLTGWGFVPVPTAAGNATILQIPAIIGGVVEGPLVGAVIGFIFGVSSFLHATVPFFKDPSVAILPRIFIGVFGYYAYVIVKRLHIFSTKRWGGIILAIGAAGLVGSVTNTVLVLAMIYVRGYLSLQACVSIALINGVPEAIVSIIITVAVVSAWWRLDRGRKGSRI